jgi:O-methyltransferase involved in polyketide biosynthesis
MNPETPRYNIDQATSEAEAMKGYLKESHPEQGDLYTTNQYQEAQESEAKNIYHSAAAVRELAKNSNLPFVKKAYEIIGGDKLYENIFSGMPHLVEMRYLASEKLITDMVNSGEVAQVVELASGLTPHAVSLSRNLQGLKRYVEVDYRVNIIKKKELNDKLGANADMRYVAGDLFKKSTWEKIEESLGDGKVLIFSEGFMLYMENKDDRDKIAENFKGTLEKHGGYFVFDDSLRYHPEFQTEPSIREFLGNLIKGDTISQEELTMEWENRGFNVERIPEDNPLSCESVLPNKKEEIALLKKHLKLWKISLKS